MTTVLGNLRVRVLAVFFAALGVSLAAAHPAPALSQRGHTFAFAFGTPGKGEGKLFTPDGIAVNDATGDVYVSDFKNKLVEEYEPVVEEGKLVSYRYSREVEKGNPSRIAVDSSTEESDPSRGDVYVATTKAAKVLYKLGPNLEQIGEPIKKVGGEKLETIDGLAVNASGELLVYLESGAIDEFNNAAANGFQKQVIAGFEASVTGEPGFGVDAEGNFYGDVLFDGSLARESEEEFRAKEEGRAALSTAAKIEGSTGNVANYTLDSEQTEGIAVNQLDVPANQVDERDDVFLDNVAPIAGSDETTITQLDPSGAVIQRFGHAGLSRGDAIAVDETTGDVYVADAASKMVYVFTLEPSGAPTVEGVTSEVIPPGEGPGVVKLSARVNPVGRPTSYHFEVGLASCSEESKPCTASASKPAGEGFGSLAVGEELPLSSLASGTYYYRVVAESEAGSVESAEGTFTVFGLLSTLPGDGRGWELVSPPNKDGAEPDSLTGEGGTVQASENGAAMTFVADGPMPAGGNVEGSRSPEPTQVLSARGKDEWSSEDISTANGTALGASVGSPPEYELFSPNLALGLVQPFGGPSFSGNFERPALSPPISEEEKGMIKQEEKEEDEIIEQCKEKALTETGGAEPAFRERLETCVVEKLGHPPGERTYLGKTFYLRDDKALSSDEPQPLRAGPAEEESFLFAKGFGVAMKNSGFLAIVDNANAPAGGEFGGPGGEGVEFTGATAELNHIVLRSYRDKPGLYEWGAAEAEGGKQAKECGASPKKELEEQLREDKQLTKEELEEEEERLARTTGAAACRELVPVSVLPDGTLLGAASLGGPEARDARHAISNDGSLVVWSALPPETADLYIRETGQPGEEHPRRETLQLDAVQPGANGQGTPSAVFQAAGEEERDGTKVMRVFFTDTQHLTGNAHSCAACSGGEPDLYVAEVPESGPLSSTLTDLTPEGIDGRAADVDVGGSSVSSGGGVLGVGEEGGSYVYFVANGALAPGASRGRCGEAPSHAGATCNLYVRHFNGTEWTPTKLIAALSVEDRPDWGVRGAGDGNPGNMTARVSPKGNYLAFMSDRSLTGYDNEDVSSKAPGERMDEEVYLYDAETGRLLCASCNPTGARPRGVFDAGLSSGKQTGEGIGLVVDRGELWGPTGEGDIVQTDHWLSGNIPPYQELIVERARYQSRYLSDEGRLFFDSADPLLPVCSPSITANCIATPTREEEVKSAEQEVGVENVYEYEPAGVGACHSGGGCVGLISSGTSPHESAFLDASASGDDVFFLTAEKLKAVNGVTQDIDTNYDVYDAHVCEPSSPCTEPAEHATASCQESPEGTRCTGTPPEPPLLSAPLGATTPSRATFSSRTKSLRSKRPKPPNRLNPNQKRASRSLPRR